MKKARSKSETKRAQILTAATELFCEQGFTSTRMEQVARAAGVSKQTVYSHFGAKEELFSAAIQHRCEAYEMVAISLPPAASVRTVLLAVARRFVAMILSREAVQVHRTCVAEAETYPQVARLFFAAGPARVIGEVTALLTRLVERGDLAIDDPHAAAMQLLKMVQGEARLREEYNIEPRLAPGEIDRYIESCVDFFLRGYAPD